MEIPQEFVAQIRSYDSRLLDGLVEALSLPPAVSVRCNTRKGISRPASRRGVAWCDAGFYLDGREQFTFDPAMHQGLYYVQDASSMIIGHIVKRLTSGGHSPIRYLDACAAPGGKTTAAIDALPAGSLVVANEYNPSRASVLRENIIKWGYPSCVVCRGDTAKFRSIPDFFDIVAADVPCSGEGMFRKDEDAVSQWSPSLVDECVSRQREIIDNLWETLRPGGYFIYSTCTFNRKENEETVEYISRMYGAESIDLSLPETWNIAPGIDTGVKCSRFMPHRTDGEGLFVAVLRKPDDCTASSRQPRKGKTGAKPDNRVLSQLQTVRSWVDGCDVDINVSDRGIITVFPKEHAVAIQLLSSTLDVIHAGVTAGMIKGRDLVPSQSLALSTMLHPAAFHRCELDYRTAIAYLRHEAIVLPEDTPRGYVAVTYNDYPLGFVKNIGNRANNLYPPEWRILSSHIPEEIPSVI